MEPKHLDEFIKLARRPGNARNEYVLFPGFKFLYVRYVTRYIKGEFVHPVLDLANMEAMKKGKGAFTELVAHIRATHPECWIYVECVLNDRLGGKLLRMGFTRQDAGMSECFFLEPLVAPCPICKAMTQMTPTLVGRICPECAALPRKENQ